MWWFLGWCVGFLGCELLCCALFLCVGGGVFVRGLVFVGINVCGACMKKRCVKKGREVVVE